MVSNRSRFDPYKGFKFRLVIGAALAAVAGLAVVKKLLPGVSAAKRRKPADHVAETSSGSRPIEGVGTSTAGFVGTTPKPKRKRASAPSRKRKGARNKARR